eukprot:Gregarina_sp_Poly_1__3194@NODE_1908_length_3103_cov_113_894928_g1232_i0_p1_GENE_NODE_1908_length_3103_cov_113_894928_g1232_i0NODE_1908_length_3103_cov_113_894928_g1232_i0_p1_ORF_typecomplete_len419_score99_83_NODE_1908_length_3103_cov_113_894928_g1232_i015132769
MPSSSSSGATSFSSAVSAGVPLPSATQPLASSLGLAKDTIKTPIILKDDGPRRESNVKIDEPATSPAFLKVLQPIKETPLETKKRPATTSSKLGELLRKEASRLRLAGRSPVSSEDSEPSVSSIRKLIRKISDEEERDMIHSLLQQESLGFLEADSPPVHEAQVSLPISQPLHKAPPLEKESTKRKGETTTEHKFDALVVESNDPSEKKIPETQIAEHHKKLVKRKSIVKKEVKSEQKMPPPKDESLAKQTGKESVDELVKIDKQRGTEPHKPKDVTPPLSPSAASGFFAWFTSAAEIAPEVGTAPETSQMDSSVSAQQSHSAKKTIGPKKSADSWLQAVNEPSPSQPVEKQTSSWSFFGETAEPAPAEAGQSSWWFGGGSSEPPKSAPLPSTPEGDADETKKSPSVIPATSGWFGLW